MLTPRDPHPLPTLRLRLHDRFRLLAGGGQELPLRQRSLRASLDASWEHLPEPARRALAQLTAFEGGFSLPAIEAVLVLPETDAWALDVVQELVQASLLSADDCASRLSMSTSVREYASSHLGAVEAAATEARHGAFFARFGEPATLDLAAIGKVSFEPDLQNLVAACERAIRRREAAVAVRTLSAAWTVWRRRGPVGSAVGLASSVVAMDAERPEPLLEAARVLGECLFLEGRGEESRAQFERVRSWARSVGDRHVEAMARKGLGDASQVTGRLDEARVHYEAAIATHRELGDRYFEAVALGNLGAVQYVQGSPTAARECLHRALELFRVLGNRQAESTVLGNLGAMEYRHGRLEAACTHTEAAIVALREAGDRRGEAIFLGNLGMMRGESGRLAQQAQADLEAALDLHRQVGERAFEARVHGHLGQLWSARGDEAQAYHHFLAALRLDREVGDRESEAQIQANLGMLHAEYGRLEDARAHHAEALRIAREIGAPSAEAMALAGQAQVHRLSRRPEEARVALERSKEILDRIGYRAGEALASVALAELDVDDARWDDARTRLEGAVATFREGGASRHEGTALTRLARLDARDAPSRALAALNRCAQLLSPDERASWTGYLAIRAEALFWLGESQDARFNLARATETAPRGHVECAAQVSRVRALLEGTGA